MSYYIDIIDQVLNENLFVVEVASKSGIVLSWNGGDSKDGFSIVGSSLVFDFSHNELVDAKFINFFTGNENRFRVEIRNALDDAIIWQGFVVPDMYSEPYTNGVTFVQFTASCGLGRLRGKYLPDDFYRDEKSIIDIFCKSLSLTGLEMDLFFSPAIENSIKKNWNDIYIDTVSFIDKEKKQDVYTIVETLLSDMLCVCYQADNRWNIEGINQRHLRIFKAKRYAYNGVFLGEYEEERLLKEITALVTPVITMTPPYNEIAVTHARVPQSFPKTIAKENNDGWVVMTGVVGEIYATDWNGNDGYYCKSVFPEYYNSFKKNYTVPIYGGVPVVEPFSESKFINLKNKIFVYKYQKLTISATFTIIKYDKVMSVIDPSAYLNPLLYEIVLNDTVIFSNRKSTVPVTELLVFEDGVAKLSFEWIVPEEGLIDVKLYRPSGPIYGTNILGFEITELKLVPVNFEEKAVVKDIISDEYTVDKKIELTYGDDDTAFSNCFRLAKLKEATISYNTILIPVIDAFSQFGNFYSVVDLDGANLIKDNIKTTYYNGVLLEDLEVFYNYFESDRMVVKTNFSITSGSFSIQIYKNNDFLGSRNSWLQWTDSVYKIETNRYSKTVANIIRRMFNVASEKLDVTALNAVKFNDLILFNYVNKKDFVVINCSWNLDENKTNLTLSRANYRDSSNTGTDPGNIPPIVNAGVDIELSNSQTTASLLAVAYDTDGYIVNQLWTKIVGGFGDVIVSRDQLATELLNLTEDIYEYQIQVTDNDGATATDTIRLVRRKSYNVSLVNTYAQGSEGSVSIEFKYKFQIDPNVDPSFNLILKGKCVLFGYVPGAYARFRIRRNGFLIFEYLLAPNSGADDSLFSIGYISTDEIVFEIAQEGRFPDIHIGSSWIELNSIEFINGSGQIVGLPIKKQPIPNPYGL